MMYDFPSGDTMSKNTFMRIGVDSEFRFWPYDEREGGRRVFANEQKNSI